MGRYPYLNPLSSVGREDMEAVRDVMERTGVVEFSQRKLDTLSGGERQTVYIAAAMAQGAESFCSTNPPLFSTTVTNRDSRFAGRLESSLGRYNRRRHPRREPGRHGQRSSRGAQRRHCCFRRNAGRDHAARCSPANLRDSLSACWPPARRRADHRSPTASKGHAMRSATILGALAVLALVVLCAAPLVGVEQMPIGALWGDADAGRCRFSGRCGCRVWR